MRSQKDEIKSLQCLLNCITLFWYYKLPLPRVFDYQPDRIYIEYDDDFLARLKLLTIKKRFGRWDKGLKGHGETAWRGWRECVIRFSMQIIEHLKLFDSLTPFEIDFDYWNPDGGVAPATGHIIEVILNKLKKRKTNPFRIMKALRKRGFKIYDLRKGTL